MTDKHVDESRDWEDVFPVPKPGNVEDYPIFKQLLEEHNLSSLDEVGLDDSVKANSGVSMKDALTSMNDLMWEFEK